MGAVLGRQSYDCGRSRILVYGSLVQELLNDSTDANMIIIESKINFCKFQVVKYLHPLSVEAL